MDRRALGAMDHRRRITRTKELLTRIIMRTIRCRLDRRIRPMRRRDPLTSRRIEVIIMVRLRITQVPITILPMASTLRRRHKAVAIIQMSMSFHRITDSRQDPEICQVNSLAAAIAIHHRLQCADQRKVHPEFETMRYRDELVPEKRMPVAAVDSRSNNNRVTTIGAALPLPRHPARTIDLPWWPTRHLNRIPIHQRLPPFTRRTMP